MSTANRNAPRLSHQAVDGAQVTHVTGRRQSTQYNIYYLQYFKTTTQHYLRLGYLGGRQQTTISQIIKKDV